MAGWQDGEKSRVDKRVSEKYRSGAIRLNALLSLLSTLREISRLALIS